MGHLSTLNLVDTNKVITNSNNGEKTILSENHNNYDSDDHKLLNDKNNKISSLSSQSQQITPTASSSSLLLLSDQNNNNGKNGTILVTNKSELNERICNDNNEHNNDDDVKLLRRSCLNEKIYEDWKGDRVLGIQFKAPLKWDKVIAITALHFACLYFALTYHTFNFYSTIWAFLTGGFAAFGITAGAHRLWTHRAYKANTPLRIILITCFSLAGQNTLYDWVRDHRVHHKFSETDADPHNANRGFFFAHCGWLMMYKHPDVIKRGRQMDMSDILADPVVQFHQKHFILMKMLFAFIIPTLIPVYLWDDSFFNAIITQCLFRYVLCLNFTWSVNSAAHLWGTRPYDRKINPAENLIVSLLAFGEGWHNYHHVFPWDYKAAELGDYKVNLATFFIDIFSKIGWAYDMKQPSQELIKRTIEKCGDGTHPVFGHHLKEVPMPEDDDDLNNGNIDGWMKNHIH